MAISGFTFTNIAAGSVDPDSPIDTTLMTNLRDNTEFLMRWLGETGIANATADHAHAGSVVDGSKQVLFGNLGAKPATLAGYGIVNAAIGNNTNNISQFSNDSGYITSAAISSSAVIDAIGVGNVITIDLTGAGANANHTVIYGGIFDNLNDGLLYEIVKPTGASTFFTRVWSPAASGAAQMFKTGTGTVTEPSTGWTITPARVNDNQITITFAGGITGDATETVAWTL